MPPSGLTPSQRRPQTLYPELSPFFGPVPWTTTRCNRLLRPLVSRIEILRKRSKGSANLEKASNDDRRRHVRVRSAGRRADTEPQHTNQCEKPIANAVLNPDWVPNQIPKKRLKHKYTARGHRDKSTVVESGITTWKGLGTAYVPGLVTITTPIISRAKLSAQKPSALESTATEKPWPMQPFDNVECMQPAKPRQGPGRKPPSHHCSQALKDVRRATSGSVWTLYEGIYSGFDALLTATSRSCSRQRKGTRSLFSTCLRQVPGFIKEEEAWQREKEEATRSKSTLDPASDVVSAVYADLESLGGSQQGGWKPLRTVVRAHGVFILAEATRARIVHPLFTRALVMLCLDLSASDEAELLLSSWVDAIPAIPGPSSTNARLMDHSVSALSSTLDTCAALSGRQSFLYRQYISLLSSKRLPPEWLATRELVPLLSQAVQCVVQESESRFDALAFLTAATQSTCAQLLEPMQQQQQRELGDERAPLHPDECSEYTPSHTTRRALDNTVFSMTATLSSVAMIGRVYDLGLSCKLEPYTRLAPRLLRCLAIDIERAASTLNPEVTSKKCSVQAIRRATWLTFADNLLVESAGISRVQERQARNSTHGSTKVLFTLMRTWEALLDASSEVGILHAPSQSLGSLICSIARGCDRATFGGGLSCLESLVHCLISLATEPTSQHSMSRQDGQDLGKIALQSAFDFAEQSENNDHFAWAEKLGAELFELGLGSGFGHDLSKPANGIEERQAAPYRWEEGLCEWIVATPAAVSKRRRQECTEDVWKTDPSADESVVGQDEDLALALARDARTPSLSMMLFGSSPISCKASPINASLAESPRPEKRTIKRIDACTTLREDHRRYPKAYDYHSELFMEDSGDEISLGKDGQAQSDNHRKRKAKTFSARSRSYQGPRHDRPKAKYGQNVPRYDASEDEPESRNSGNDGTMIHRGTLVSADDGSEQAYRDSSHRGALLGNIDDEDELSRTGPGVKMQARIALGEVTNQARTNSRPSVGGKCGRGIKAGRHPAAHTHSIDLDSEDELCLM